MRNPNRTAFFLFLIAMMLSVATHAQSSNAAATDSSDEDLRKMVRELSLRVSALEEELHKEHAAASTAAEKTAVTPTTAPTAVAEVRSGVESVPNSVPAASPSTANAAASTQAAGASSTPVLSALPTQLPGGATLNYVFDGYYGYDFNHPIGRSSTCGHTMC